MVCLLRLRGQTAMRPQHKTARKHFFLKKEAKTSAHLVVALGQR
jgi:hypothetical protein